MCREYQDPLYNHKENRPLLRLSFLLSTHIHLPWLADLPSSLSTHRKENVPHVLEGPTVDTSTSKGLRGKTRVVIGDSDDENEFPQRELRRKC